MSVFVVEIWGDYACFTRPEAKVERLSYPVITPSAARGLLDAVYAKPVEFSWRIDKIEVLKPIKFIALRRNEVKNVISSNMIMSVQRKGGVFEPIVADDTRELSGTDAKGRTQRQTMALKDVRYRIHAHIRPKANFGGNPRSLESQAKRRLENGKCFYQPYLGCREFVGYFSPRLTDAKPIGESLDLGWMLYDVFDLDETIIDNAKPKVSLFYAEMKDGVIEIPPWESAGVRKPG